MIQPRSNPTQTYTQPDPAQPTQPYKGTQRTFEAATQPYASLIYTRTHYPEGFASLHPILPTQPYKNTERISKVANMLRSRVGAPPLRDITLSEQCFLSTRYLCDQLKQKLEKWRISPLMNDAHLHRQIRRIRTFNFNPLMSEGKTKRSCILGHAWTNHTYRACCSKQGVQFWPRDRPKQRQARWCQPSHRYNLWGFSLPLLHLDVGISPNQGKLWNCGIYWRFLKAKTSTFRSCDCGQTMVVARLRAPPTTKYCFHTHEHDMCAYESRPPNA